MADEKQLSVPPASVMQVFNEIAAVVNDEKLHAGDMPCPECGLTVHWVFLRRIVYASCEKPNCLTLECKPMDD